MPVACASRTLVIMVCLLIAVVYVMDYLQSGRPKHSNGEHYVIQSNVDQFHSNLLLERQPIVLQDQVLAVRPLISEALRYQQVHVRDLGNVRLSSLDPRPLDTVAKATFISPKRRQHTHDAGEKVMLLARPLRRSVGNKQRQQNDNDDGNSPDIVFKMRPSQVLILPPHWQVSCMPIVHLERDKHRRLEEAEEVDVNVVESFDLTSLIMWPVIRLCLPYGRGVMPVPP